MWIFGTLLLAFLCLKENVEENLILYVNCEVWKAKKLTGEKLYEHFRLKSVLCLCWTLHMWFLEAMSRWTSYCEITSMVSWLYGVRKDRIVPLVMQGHTYGTPQSSLTSLDLWQHVYWPGPLLVWFVWLQLSREKVPSALFPVPS